MKIKRLSALLLLLILAAFSIQLTYAAALKAPAAPQKIPNDFWKLSPLYDKALKANDNKNIIAYGLKLIKLFDGMAENTQVLEIVTPRFQKIALAYEALGDYDNAVENYKKYIPRAKALGWKDGADYAEAKLKVLDFDIDLYTTSSDIGGNKYYNAKYEPLSGIYFGSAYDNDPRIGTYSWQDIKAYFPKKNSAYLIYLDWEQSVEAFDRYYTDARQNGIGIQLAWNISDARIADTLKNIRNYNGYITNTAKYLGKLDIPVFLRFACEMNIKDNAKDPAAYIAAFRYVTDVMRQYAPNVAMVWSPNDISAKGRTYEQYYPGDSYVDWVGVSTYDYLYFQGKKDWGSLQDSINTNFMTGEYVNPVAKIKPIMDLYGGKKPIMLSETGIGHYSKSQKEDLTSWAAVQFKRLYIYGPMRYPELKGIFYFNVNIDGAAKHDDYSLYGSTTLNNLYNSITGSDYFLSGIGQAAPFRYVKIDDYKTAEKNISIYTYTIVPKALKPTVKYRIDNTVAASSDELPYTLKLDASKYSKGTHSFTVEVYNNGKQVRSKNYQLVISDKQTEIILK